MISGTVIVASSSKRLYVWDVAAEKVLASVPEGETHSRAITCLRLAQPHAEYQSVESLDLFYTAAMDGTDSPRNLGGSFTDIRYNMSHYILYIIYYTLYTLYTYSSTLTGALNETVEPDG